MKVAFQGQLEINVHLYNHILQKYDYRRAMITTTINNKLGGLCVNVEKPILVPRNFHIQEGDTIKYDVYINHAERSVFKRLFKTYLQSLICKIQS